MSTPELRGMPKQALQKSSGRSLTGRASGGHAAISFSYINKGHQPNHYRDGLAAQIWGRTPLLDQRLSLALGVGSFTLF